MKKNSKCIVYGLFDPDNGKLRYIGQTRVKLKRRFHFHIKAVRQIEVRLSPVEMWIARLLDAGKSPEIRALASNATWNVSEILMIAKAKADGHELLNVLRGGSDSYDALMRENGQRLRYGS